MKSSKAFFILLLSLLGFSEFNSAKSQSVDVNFTTFYNDLSPHGRWINNPSYGQVWTYNDPNFRPYYTDGHWEFTDYGWSWVSDFDWGWAPFHYGRWEHDPYYGWIWIPGYEWASAWVSWSQNDGYYGWAPLGFGVDINVLFGSIPYDRWTYVPRQYICSPQVRNYYVAPGRSNNYFRNSITINNIYTGRGNGRFMMGPNRSDVERYTHNRIETRRIDNFGRPGNNASNRDRDWDRNDRDRQNGRNNDDRRITDNNRRNDVPDNNRRNDNIDNNRRNDNNLPRRNEGVSQNNQEQRDIQASRDRILNRPARNENDRTSTNTFPERSGRNANPGNLPITRRDNPRQDIPRRDQPIFEQRTTQNQPRVQNPQPDMNATRQSERRIFGNNQNQSAGRQNESRSNSNPDRQDRSDNNNRGRRN